MKEHIGNAFIIGGFFTLTIMIMKYLSIGETFSDGIPDIFWMPIFTIMIGGIYTVLYNRCIKEEPKQELN